MATTQSYSAEQLAILNRLGDNWTRTPIRWPNIASAPTEESHVEPVVNRAEAFNASVSAASKLVRHPGLLTLNIRVPLGGGDVVALDYADELAALFRNVTVDSITFRAPTVRDLGPEGAWYRVQVDCPFYRDSIFNA